MAEFKHKFLKLDSNKNKNVFLNNEAETQVNEISDDDLGMVSAGCDTTQYLVNNGIYQGREGK
ncbi:MAG: hypothetical protein K5917_05410 [Clostridiales bacterium]|nr:hypothetical protein [Clostridiales bacterium]